MAPIMPITTPITSTMNAIQVASPVVTKNSLKKLFGSLKAWSKPQCLSDATAMMASPAPDEALHHALGDERDPHEPVRRADELHHLDLAPPGEGREADRVDDQEQRRREQDEREHDEDQPDRVGGVDQALERLTGRLDLVDALLRS